MSHSKKGKSGLRSLIKLAAVVVFASAVIEQLRRPASERTWRGKVAGAIPYDLRPPSVSKVRNAIWDPEGPFIKPRAFGVGWTVNVGRIVSTVRRKTA